MTRHWNRTIRTSVRTLTTATAGMKFVRLAAQASSSEMCFEVLGYVLHRYASKPSCADRAGLAVTFSVNRNGNRHIFMCVNAFGLRIICTLIRPGLSLSGHTDVQTGGDLLDENAMAPAESFKGGWQSAALCLQRPSASQEFCSSTL